MGTDRSPGRLLDRYASIPGAAGVRSLASPAIALPLLGILVSETFLFLGERGAIDAGRLLALGGHLVTLLVCTLAPLRFERARDHEVFRAFALVPLFRLVNLGMPVFFQLTVFWFPMVYGPLIPALYVLGTEGTPADLRLGTRELVLLAPPTVASAVVLAEVEFAILHTEPLIPALTAVQLLLLGAVMVGFVGLIEELVFRGVLQRTLQARLGRWSGLLLASAVFGVMHSGYGLVSEVVVAGAIGLVFGLAYDYTDSIALISVMHGLLNVFLFGVIPIQGSQLHFRLPPLALVAIPFPP